MHTVTQSRLLAYVGLAYVISWVLWTPAIVARDLNSPFVAFGTFGPAFAALIVVAWTEGRVGLVAFLRRLFTWRVHPIWYLVACFLFPLWGLVIIGVVGLAGPAELLELLPLVLVNFSLGLLLNPTLYTSGPLGEEPGWRGYALPLLLQRLSPLAASLVLGLIWTVWHLPLELFFPERRVIPDLFGHLLAYTGSLLPLAILFTWLYLNGKQSVLLAVLFHTSFNLAIGRLIVAGFDLPARLTPTVLAWGVNGALWLLVALVIVLFGPRLHKQRKRLP